MAAKRGNNSIFLKAGLPFGALAFLGVVVALLALGPAAAAPGDDVADRVFGQGGVFTTQGCNSGGISAGSLCNPTGVAVDGAGNFYVADQSNNRVLGYISPLTTDTVADIVFGQLGSFTTNTANKGAVAGMATASSLFLPFGVALDGTGHLYVADLANQRVLEYDSPLTTDTVADRVFGQGGSFTSRACGVTAGSLCNPTDAALDAASNLYVADFANHRVLEYDSPLTTDTVADRVFGQSSFTTNACNNGGVVSASSLCRPFGVGLDSPGNLYVGDRDNHRVLEYNIPLTTDTVADRVFGQGSFTTNACNNGGVVSASSLCLPVAVGLDGAGDLYVADSSNNRVLEYDNPLATDTVADLVFGQLGSFTSAICNKGGLGGMPTARSLCIPAGVAVDSAGNLYVSDLSPSRVLEYDTPVLIATPTPTASPTPSPTPTPAPTAGKVTGGGSIEDPAFSTLGELLSGPAVVASTSGVGGERATFGFVVNDGVSPSGNLEYIDHGMQVRIKATSIEQLSIGGGTCGTNTHARFVGTADVTFNHGTSLATTTSQSYEVEVDDCGEPGIDADIFKITTTGYSNGPTTLIGGNIKIH